MAVAFGACLGGSLRKELLVMKMAVVPLVARWTCRVALSLALSTALVVSAIPLPILG